MMSKFIRTQAFVLRRIDYGEADRILNLITPLGQISAIARGVRKSKSKLGGGIEMLSLVDLVLVDGRGEMKTVTSARLVQYFDQILTDYDRLTFAHLVLKQISGASREINGGDWFEIVREVLVALNQPATDFALIQAWFYLRLASESGETLNLISDVEGEVLRADVKYCYDCENKALRRSAAGVLATNHIKLLRLLLSSPLSIVLKVKDVADFSEALLAVARVHAAVN